MTIKPLLLVLPCLAATALGQGRPANAIATPTKTVPRIPGTETQVVVNRGNGRVAVLKGDKLQVLDGLTATKPLAEMEIPGKRPRLVEFRGPNVLYLTHEVNDLPVVYVAVSGEGRERLAWPNEGISNIFPSETSRLTLDGKGVYDFLRLDPPVRELFGLPDSIPLGAGVAASFRFAGEKLLARGSEIFTGVVALSPDDMLLTVKGGGAMRYARDGVSWKREATGGEWRIVDVAPNGDLAAVVDGAGALLGLDLSTGDVRWQLPASQASRVAAARFLSDGRLLVRGGEGDKPVSILDAQAGVLSREAFSASFARLRLSWVLAYWLEHSDGLSDLWEVAPPEGAAWLIRGPEGWYLVPRF